MIPPLLLMLASYVLRILGTFTRPSSVTCPPSFALNGTRRSGETECVLPGPDVDCSGSLYCAPGEDLIRLPVRVWCAEGEQPLVITHRKVECRTRRTT